MSEKRTAIERYMPLNKLADVKFIYNASPKITKLKALKTVSNVIGNKIFLNNLDK